MTKREQAVAALAISAVICVLAAPGGPIAGEQSEPAARVASEPVRETSPSAAETAPPPKPGTAVETPSSSGAPPAKPAASDRSTVTRIDLSSRDGHAFSADEYIPRAPESAPDILLVPDLGQNRSALTRVATRLAELGYHVAAMDNTGQRRSVKRGKAGAPSFERIDTKFLDRLRMDVEAGAVAVRQRGAASANFAVVGYGIGANASLLYAIDSSEVDAIALVLPGHDCEEYDPTDAIASFGRRPMLLIEADKKRPTDLSLAMRSIIGSGLDPTKSRVSLPRDPAHTPEDQVYGLDELVGWLRTSVPVPSR